MLIYIADDDEAYSNMLQSCLRDSGYETELARDVSELSAMATKRRPDAVIVDMQMPAGGGLAAVKILTRGDGPPIAIVLCSAMPVNQVEKWFPDVRRIDFVQKPPDIDALLTKLAALLAQVPPESE